MADMQRQGAAGVQTLEGGSLLDEILAETKMTPGDEGYEVAKKGVQAFIAELIAPKREGEKVDKALVDALIAEIDAKLSSRRVIRGVPPSVRIAARGSGWACHDRASRELLPSRGGQATRNNPVQIVTSCRELALPGLGRRCRELRT
jgi:hypothetical protein